MKNGLLSLHRRGIQFLQKRRYDVDLRKYRNRQSDVTLSNGATPVAFTFANEDEEIQYGSRKLSQTRNLSTDLDNITKTSETTSSSYTNSDTAAAKMKDRKQSLSTTKNSI